MLPRREFRADAGGGQVASCGGDALGTKRDLKMEVACGGDGAGGGTESGNCGGKASVGDRIGKYKAKLVIDTTVIETNEIEITE